MVATFELYGCYLESANYNSLAYQENTPVSVTLAIAYDNAIQTPKGTGIGTEVGRTISSLATGGGQYSIIKLIQKRGLTRPLFLFT